MSLQAAAQLGLGLQAWAWVDGHGLLKILVDGYVANASVPAISRLDAITTLASLLKMLLADPKDKEPLGEQLRHEVGRIHDLL